MNKKALCAALSLALALGALCPPALAAAEDGAEGTEQAAIIDVTVPTIGQFELNPYGLYGGEQVVHEAQKLTNNSDVSITVSAAVTASTTGEVIISTVPIDQAETVKQAYLYVEFQDVDDASQIVATPSGADSFEVLTVGAGESAAFQLFGELTKNPTNAWNTSDGITVTVCFTFCANEVVSSEDAISAVSEESEDPEAVSEENELDESAAPETTPAAESTETPAETTDPETPAESEEPVTETETPVEGTEEPVEETEEPVEETEEPAAETETPVETTDPPVEETPPSDEGTEDPGSTSEDATEQTDSETTAEP